MRVTVTVVLEVAVEVVVVVGLGIYTRRLPTSTLDDSSSLTPAAVWTIHYYNMYLQGKKFDVIIFSALFSLTNTSSLCKESFLLPVNFQVYC